MQKAYMTVYYNDVEPFVCEWLKNLIAAGHLPAGDVDNRSIKEVTAHDVAGYTQCHFFAGIGGWAYALQRAGWPTERKVWTGSCPCQPFSVAGRGEGADDARHLWPEWFRLISECRPPILFGEQVASKDGRSWLGAVRADLETVGYAVGAADLCAAGVGAPHIRQRLWFVADAERNTRGPGRLAIESGESDGAPSTGSSTESGRRGNLSLMADNARDGRREERTDCGGQRTGDGSEGRAAGPESGGHIGELGDASDPRLEGHAGDEDNRDESGRYGAQPCGSVAETGGLSLVADTDGGQSRDGDLQRSGEHGQQPQDRGASAWSACEWLPCRDGKARPVEPSLKPLAHGIPQRVGRLRAYGNAIVPEAAETFIRSVMECRP